MAKEETAKDDKIDHDGTPHKMRRGSPGGGSQRFPREGLSVVDCSPGNRLHYCVTEVYSIRIREVSLLINISLQCLSSAGEVLRSSAGRLLPEKIQRMCLSVQQVE